MLGFKWSMNSGRVFATLHLSPEKVNLLRLDVPQRADELGPMRVTRAAGTNTPPDHHRCCLLHFLN